MDKRPAATDSSGEYIPRQNAQYLDDEDDWVTDFDDEGEDLDKFDLGAYAGALR